MKMTEYVVKPTILNPQPTTTEGVIESPHSVELSCNAKGQFSGKVKCYGITPDEALQSCTRIMRDVEQLIKQKNGV